MKARRITIFFACIIGTLAILTFIFPENGITIGGHTYYFPSMKKLIASNQRTAIDINRSNLALPSEITEKNDSIAFFQHFIDSSDLRFWMPEENYFDDFWKQAEKAGKEGRILRILHYGDSQIEADRLTAQLRSYMQKTFGGGGPGMIPATYTTPSAAFRINSSNELLHLASFGDSTASRSRGNYGVMMQSFRLNGATTLTIQASNDSKADSAIKQFSTVRFVYNNKGSVMRASLSNSKIRYNNDQRSSEGVKSMLWQLDTAVDRVTLKASGNADLYCITLDDGPGVAVDNIPMRGCSGQQFTLVNKNLLSEAYRQLDVGMIILEFGGNSVPYLKSENAISTYCTSLGKQIDYVHQCCPDAKILFIGPSDMSTRHRDNLQTYPMLPTLIDSLIVTANNHGAAYWSIYHAMGGWNSMMEWHRQGFAGNDYIHFTPKGAVTMGNRLAEALSVSYRLYAMRRQVSSYKR
jgi:hypothetical protein